QKGKEREAPYRKPATRAENPRSGVAFRVFRDSRRMLLFFLLETKSAALQPSVEFRSVGINRAALVVDVAMNGHALALFPALDGTDIPFYISGDFLPGIKGRGGGLIGCL